MGLFKSNKKKDNKPEELQDESQGLSHLQGDRNDITVTGKTEGKAKKIILITSFLGVALTAFFLFGYYSLKSDKDESLVREVKNSERDQYERSTDKKDGLRDVKREQERLLSLVDLKRGVDDEGEDEKEATTSNSNPELPPEPKPTAAMPVVPDLPPEPATNSQGEIILTAKERRLMGNTMVSTESIAVPQESNPNFDNQAISTGGNQDDGDFLRGSTFQAGSVSRLKNRSFLLSAGTAAPCVLKTKIVTSYPAFTMCQLTKNIYSDDGKNILVRAGAEFHGEQTKVMQQGVARVFVNWTSLKDRNMNIRVDALGADGLGAAGLPAWIDSHFWERFGGAIMLSFIDDALATAANNAKKSNSNDGVTFDNSQNAASDMARIALENSINIPPTAVVNQGEMLTVIVPRYIDFSSVYRNR